MMIERSLIWLFHGDPCPLIKCPPGLFLFNGTLGLKSAWKADDPVLMDVQIVESGQEFWGGTQDCDSRASLMVQPVRTEQAT